MDRTNSERAVFQLSPANIEWGMMAKHARFSALFPTDLRRESARLGFRLSCSNASIQEKGGVPRPELGLTAGFRLATLGSCCQFSARRRIDVKPQFNGLAIDREANLRQLWCKQG